MTPEDIANTDKIVFANLNSFLFFNIIVKFMKLPTEICTPLTISFGPGSKPEEDDEKTISFNCITFTEDTVCANMLLNTREDRDFIKTRKYVQKFLDEKLKFFPDEEMVEIIKTQNESIMKNIDNSFPINIPLGGFNYNKKERNIIEIKFFNRGVLPKGGGHQLLALFLLYYNEYHDKIDNVELTAVDPKPYYRMGFKLTSGRNMSANSKDIIEKYISKHIVPPDVYIKIPDT